MTKARILANLISDNAELADGQISVAEVVGAAPLASPSFTGNITVSGNVDGRDIAADGTKLDGVEASADVTDATNVTAAGALMDSELTNIAAIKALNQGVATTDEVAFDNTTLNAIAKDISDTAVDIFVYDTRKDSDGGAWRKRTQNTSWYNEAASATRGSRKEFPSVAVIVAESTQLTIYDGDDPDLPMWRVFNRDTSTPTANNAWYRDASSFVVSSVAMKNGSLIFGVTVSSGTSNTTAGLLTADFIGDELRRKSSASANSVRGVPVAESNNNPVLQMVTSDPLISTIINDIAMTVLPNAPIDAATGLPVPTIAVATDGGVSVIKDDGTVRDYTSTHGGTAASDYVTFDPVTHAIYFTTDYGGSGDAYKINAKPIPTADAALGVSTYTSFQNFDGDIQSGGNITVPHLLNGGSVSDATDINALQSTGEAQLAIAEGVGLSQLYEDRAGLTDSMIAYTASDYATGWMQGAIKLATLSDTDDTNVTGSELVTNTALSDWLNTGATTWSSGALTLTGNTYTSNSFTTVSGKTYTWSVEITASSGTYADLRVGSSENGQDIYDNPTNIGVGKYSVTFTATSSTTYITLKTHYPVGSSSTTTFDNISVRLAEEDRSVNGNGVQVFGSITKSAGPSGRDLVGYSGFSSSNYFKQPYNSGLDFGTGDFSYSGWFYKSDATPATILHRSSSRNGEANWNNSGQIHQLEFNGNSLVGAIYNSGFGNQSNLSVTDDDYVAGRWVNFVFMRKSSSMELWLDGELKDQATNTLSATNTSAELWIGGRPNISVRPFAGVLALFRASATAPSPEQIKKIYEDEKVLLQDGAQATLYAASPASGSPDAVTALAYDDATDLLHVGTDNGRSVFQGLRRVDNTTDAVGAAISASNGLVAED